MSFKADLHCHTTCSDGQLSPEALLHKAHACGLQGLSITDHDTLEAYTPSLFTTADLLGITLLPGVELSTFHKETSVHILGYAIDLNDRALGLLIERLKKRRYARNKAIAQKLTEIGLPVYEEELVAMAPLDRIGRPHIARLLVQKGYVESEKKAFSRYLDDKAPCYFSGDKVPVEEGIAAIHAAGGKAVLAHPHFFKKKRLVQTLLSFPFDGIECYYASFMKDRERAWIKQARESGRLITGGSDFHGEDRVHSPLGASWVGKDDFDALLR